MTKTGGRLPVEEPDELGALALRQPSNGLRLADPALVQEAGSLDAAELRHRHQDVEDLRRRDVLRRIAEDVVDVCRAGFQVLFQLRPADADVVGPLERFHALIQRAEGCLGLSLERWHERRILTSGAGPSTMRKGLDLQGVYLLDTAAVDAARSPAGVASTCARPIALSRSPTSKASISLASSVRIRPGASGSEKRMVPSETLAAPAARNSSASRPEAIPPIPTIGRPVAA